MQWQRRWGVITLTGIALLAGCAAHPATDANIANVDRLLALTRERLDAAPAVAQNKWNTRAPVEDLPRERQIVADAKERAAEFGLDPQLAADFLAAQIEASKVVQRELHRAWSERGQPPFAEVADLSRDIRPRLDRLTPELLRALAVAQPVLRTPGGKAVLGQRSAGVFAGVPDGKAAQQAALAPLMALSN